MADKFLERNPRLHKTLRTRGKRGCQFWLKIDGDHPESSKIKLDGKAVGEWRSTGNQSVVYGQHPDGPRYQILTQAKPVTIKFDEINWPTGWIGKFNEPPPKKDAKIHERIEAYVATIPSAVSHQGGHDQAYTVACALTWGFDLSEAEALPYFETYNLRCQPPWPHADLLHKLADSVKDTTHKKPRGHLLKEDASDREMVGGSILDFANAPVDTTATLLGDQWST